VRKPEIQQIILIGAGKLAWHLGTSLIENGLKVTQVFNRTPARGEKLASHLGSMYIDSLDKINRDADIYIIAVSDNGIGEVVAGLEIDDNLVVHTSGAVDLGALKAKFKSCGVFYPLQTFSYTQTVDFTRIPVCIEANTPEAMKMLLCLANKLSGTVVHIDSIQRKHLHLAAVFACNFPNFMYVIAENILTDSQLSPELLLPLIHQTNQILTKSDFFSRQTGPAVRGDMEVIARHQELLLKNQDYLEIYNIITQNIIHYKSKHGEL
jgi:predicted short-subunit dehydrogenase-like oxidoreductase (DUF2520 family)